MLIVDNSANDSETNRLIAQVFEGNSQAWEQLLGRHQERLRRMVSLRLDRRLQGRIAPSDVIQEASLDAVQRLPEYVASPSVPFFVWLRYLTAQRLAEQHRRHLGAKARDVSREVGLFCHGALPEATSAALAAHLLGRETTPSEAAIRSERRWRLQEALNAMAPIEREILALRHYEQLSNGEVATVLGIDKSAASKRYARALVRLKELLTEFPGESEP